MSTIYSLTCPHCFPPMPQHQAVMRPYLGYGATLSTMAPSASQTTTFQRRLASAVRPALTRTVTPSRSEASYAPSMDPSQGQVVMEYPPEAEPCLGQDNMRALLTKVGFTPAPATGNELEDGIQILLSYAAWAEQNGIPEADLNDNAKMGEICQLLLSQANAAGGENGGGEAAIEKPANGSWWAKQSSTTKMAIGLGGVAAVGALIYVATKD